MPKKKTTEQFIEDARKVHGDKYDYSKAEYVNKTIKVGIICPEHGEFLQSPDNHLQGAGCPLCGKQSQINKRRLSVRQFIESSNTVHRNKYDYSKVNYVNNHTKVCIICPEHGEFWQRPEHHLNGHGCSKCAGCYSYSTEEWIEKAHEIHGDKYDYSNVKYVKSDIPVDIICKKHGMFQQMPISHLRGNGCQKCYHDTKRIVNKENVEEIRQSWIDKFYQIHGNRYDYSKVEYVNCKTKVCITCKEHGDFWQAPSDHSVGHGCPRCNRKGFGEYSYEEIVKLGLMYKTKKEFRDAYRNEYDYLQRHKLLDAFYKETNLKTSILNKAKRAVYSYIIIYNGKKYVYVGLTWNLDERHKAHVYNLHGKDTLANFCSKIGVPVPKYNIEYDYEDAEKASIHEGEVLNKYIENGYIPINKAKCGNTGSNKKKFSCTLGECIESAKPYIDKGRYEWMIHAGKFYLHAKDMQWLDICCPPKRKCVLGVKVKQIDEYGNTINIFNTISEAAEKVLGDKNKSGNISSCCRGVQKTSGGFRWEYV